MRFPRKLLLAAVDVVRRGGVPIDRLPYTPRFDALYAQFRSDTGSTLTAHEFWWLLQGIRKRGWLGPQSRYPKGDQ